jgi:mannose/cellobiose epimerase-like protein (N-acyl-D-glucosamine 2-epimerase family)/N-acetylmuramic acid 6-phosphate (MurNAc-6-P) etherase
VNDYRPLDELLTHVIPFWERYSRDERFGGYITCLDRDGTIFDTDKFVWLQARQLWMFSHIYRTVDRRDEWLETASIGANFLEANGRNGDGDWYFSLLRDGTPHVAPYNIFTDYFAAMAFAEYAAATQSDHAAEIARATWRRIASREENPKGRWNKVISTRRPIVTMAVPMIRLNVVDVFRHTIGVEGLGLGREGFDRIIDTSVEAIIDRHIDQELRTVFERVLPDGTHPDSMDGRLLNPGHAAEALWMVIEAAESVGRSDWIEQAGDALLWTIERGWDEEYGGIYYYQDYRGFPPEKLEHEMKLWWVHLESMYAFQVAATSPVLAKNRQFSDWCEKISEYTWDRFPDHEFGEWYGYLRRDGSVSTTLKGGKWKGCFHVPRILLKSGRRDAIVAADEEARRFVGEEKQFHLGHLVTEQSHTKTQGLSNVIAMDVKAGIEQLLSVDRDLPAVAERVIGGAEWRALSNAIAQTILNGGSIRFSGCGSTGRLAAILETMWRRVWRGVADAYQDDDARFRRFGEFADRVAGLITGGDRALIKSVESFEDYQEFGRRQIRDVGITSGDLCIAISEGGETSSVIGTAWEAIDVGADVFFLYNNPTATLTEGLTRSREIIEHPSVTAIDLTTGPMAIAGSTRMQATTLEMLVVGAAIDTAVSVVLKANGIASDDRFSVAPLPSHRYTECFSELLDSLSTDDTLEKLAAYTVLEEDVYRRSGLVTYVAERYLLDVFSDTSERTPTFNLPPMRSTEESDDQPSWAFAKHPRLKTPEAWRAMLNHKPRGLEWDTGVYREMNAPNHLVANPPHLAGENLLTYPIGAEFFEERLQTPGSIAVGLSIGEEDDESIASAIDKLSGKGFSSYHLSVNGRRIEEPVHEPKRFSLNVTIPPTVISLYEHIAIKLILNTISTATMARMGRVRGNYMIQVDPTNKKLIDRGARIIAGLTGCSYDRACRELYRTGTFPRFSLMGKSRVATTIDRLAGEGPPSS